MSCHNSGATTISTHSNADFTGRAESTTFELLCIQCHEPHGSTNLYNIRSLIRVQQNPAIITTGPVVFTSLTGADSYDEVDSALPESAASNVDDLCVTCHVNVNNIGYPMNPASHTGGGNHASGADYRGQNCVTCHPHSADAAASTRDGFMPSGGSCKGCHAAPQGALPRRQIVGAAGDFQRASHHVLGASDAVTDADCEICHEQTNHQGGVVYLKNADTGAALLATNNAQYETFCASCHDANGMA